MRPNLILLVLISLHLSVFGQTQKVCTFNIKFDNPQDGVHQWQNRKTSVINFIKIENLEVIGMQEVLHSQIEYLDSNLLEYQRVGVGREDGKTKGEYAPIYFKKDRYQLLESNTFWLSPNRNQPSKGWDSALPRICTWAKLYDKQNKDTLLYMNTHFDHVGTLARKKSAELIIEVIEEMNFEGKTVLMGDFNLEPDRLPINQILDASFIDAFKASLKLGPVGTYNGFQLDKTYTRRIDYIFLKNLSPLTYRVNSMVMNQTFLSDHFPVVVEIQ